MLISSAGRPAILLASGERKRVTSDRVLYVQGPPDEVAVVRQMFDLVLSRGYGPTQIARYLNSKGIPFSDGSQWIWSAVSGVLRDPKYAGDLVWRRGTCSLNQPYRTLPKSEWVVAQHVIEPVIERSVFDEVQRKLQPVRWTKASVLSALRNALAEQPASRITSVTQLLRERKHLPSAAIIERFFGSIPNASLELGIQSTHTVSSTHRLLSTRLQSQLIRQLLATNPLRVQIANPLCGLKRGVMIDKRHRLMVVQAQPFSRIPGAWQLNPTREERQNLCLCCVVSEDYEAVKAMYLVSAFEGGQLTYLVRPGGASLRKAIPVPSLADVCDLVCATSEGHRDCPVIAVRRVTPSSREAIA